jgi:ribosomal protein S18 acetylase RimI-like enzyme
VGTVSYRAAASADAEAIARLHADNWRRYYRGAYSDSYLDGDVAEERRAVWVGTLQQAQVGTFTIVAEIDGPSDTRSVAPGQQVAPEQRHVAGFAHTRLDADPRWGALLENLHVADEIKRQGVGRALMAATADQLAARKPGSGLYLWVLEQNTAAQAFYAAQGGICVERGIRGPFPGGGTAPAFRYAWPDPVSAFSRSP